MPYPVDAEAFFRGFPTEHYVRKVKTGGYRPTPMPKFKPVSYGRARNIARVEAKRCMQRLAEKKHNTTAVGAVPVPVGGQVNSLVIMSQGTSATTRTGNQIHLSLLTVEAFLYLAAGSTGDTIRTIIGWDTEANGANVTVSTVLESASPAACYNRDQVGKRIRILADRVDNVNAMTATVGTLNKTYRLQRKLDKVVYYQSNAGTISDVLKNNLFYLTISANGVVNSIINAQICYTDL